MRLSFSGTPHLRECDETYGCTCSATMSKQWHDAWEREQARAKETQAPVADDGAPVAPMAEHETERLPRETNADVVGGCLR